MNPITQTRNQMKLNDRELEMGVAGTKNSWHQEYKDSAWVFMGGMPYQLTEGDVICMFSQYGEVVHINLIRDHTSGKSKGFGFLCYEDQRSTILAVDNLNGFKILGRLIRVDHIHQYKLPKDLEKLDQDKRQLFMEGVAPKLQDPDPSSDEEEEEEEIQLEEKKKKKKKDKKKHKKKKKKKDKSNSDSEDSDEIQDRTKVKDKSVAANGSGKEKARNPYRRSRSSSREDRSREDRSRDKRMRSRSRERYNRSRSRERTDKRRKSRSRERRRD